MLQSPFLTSQEHQGSLRECQNYLTFESSLESKSHCPVLLTFDPHSSFFIHLAQFIRVARLFLDKWRCGWLFKHATISLGMAPKTKQSKKMEGWVFVISFRLTSPKSEMLLLPYSFAAVTCLPEEHPWQWSFHRKRCCHWSSGQRSHGSRSLVRERYDWWKLLRKPLQLDYLSVSHWDIVITFAVLIQFQFEDQFWIPQPKLHKECMLLYFLQNLKTCSFWCFSGDFRHTIDPLSSKPMY